jgi:hypothetical protein
MSKLFSLLMLNLAASGAILPYRIVKAVAGTDDAVSQATAPSEKLYGVSGQLGAASGARLDVHLQGLVPVEYGATVAHGDPLTADAEGRAVPATFGDSIIGYATEKGDEDEIGSMLLAAVAAAATPPRVQSATGTLVAGTCTIDEDIVVTANTKAYPTPQGAITGSTNFACLSHDPADNTPGVADTGAITIEALTVTGVVDVDAAGAFHVLLIG